MPYLLPMYEIVASFTSMAEWEASKYASTASKDSPDTSALIDHALKMMGGYGCNPQQVTNVTTTPEVSAVS